MPVRSTPQRRSGESNQLVTEGDAFGEVHAERPPRVFAQTLNSHGLGSLGRRGSWIRALLHRTRCYWRQELLGGHAILWAMWVQRTIRLSARPRGFHLVTGEVLQAVPELEQISVGLLHLLIQHTSASLTLNENASPEVRHDFESWFDRAVPEGAPYWTHTLEGDDDMPAHVKAALLGPSLTLPVSGARLALGTWQGIYLCEHRDHAGPRSLVATAWGEAGDG